MRVGDVESIFVSFVYGDMDVLMWIALDGCR